VSAITELDRIVHRAYEEVARRVLTTIEEKCAIGDMSLHFSEETCERIRVLRGKVHGCDPSEWKEPRHVATGL
jgi:hypothetical protein